MNERSRRQFMQSSAVALGAAGVVGAGIGQQTATAQEGEIPAFAEWIPEGDTILNQQGELFVTTYTIQDQFEWLGELRPGGEILLQFEPFLFTASNFDRWKILTSSDLGEPILGSLVGTEDLTNADTSNVPAERHTIVGRTSVYTGEFDIDSIAQVVQDSSAEETETDGVYEYPTSGAVIAWGEGYLIQGATREEVASVRDTGDGDQPPRYEGSAELQELFSAVEHDTQTTLRFIDNGTLSVSQYNDTIDYSPLDGALGYVSTLGYDSETSEFDATTVIRYPVDGTIDTDQIAGIITNELSREITTEGQAVRVTARYNRDDIGFSPDDGDDTDDGTDDGDSSGQNETDDSNMDDNESSEDDSESSDGSGPGFGILSAVSGLGGAGYLLSRRLGDDD